MVSKHILERKTGEGKRRKEFKKQDRKPELFDRQRLDCTNTSTRRREKPYIRITESSKVETNLSYEQLRVIVRIAKLELDELIGMVRPERVKVIKELLDLIRTPSDNYNRLTDREFSRLLQRKMKMFRDESELAEAEPELYRELERRRAEHGIIS